MNARQVCITNLFYIKAVEINLQQPFQLLAHFTHVFWDIKSLECVSDIAISLAPKKDIYYIFPKKYKNSNSSIVIKKQKTAGSIRKVFLPKPLIEEVKARIIYLEKCKSLYGKDYNHKNLLFCNSLGEPTEPRRLVKMWTKWQKENGISNYIDLQGLRKSGQTHKVHITNHNYGLVAEAGGQTTEVLLSNYLAVHDNELMNLRDIIEDDFYGVSKKADEETLYVNEFLKKCQENPKLLAILINGLKAGHKIPEKHSMQLTH